MEYIKKIEEIKEELRKIDNELFNETFKNERTNFRVHAQNKILSIVLDLENLQNGFKIESF